MGKKKEKLTRPFRRRELKSKFMKALHLCGESWRIIRRRHKARRKLSLVRRIKLLGYVKGVNV